MSTSSNPLYIVVVTLLGQEHCLLQMSSAVWFNSQDSVINTSCYAEMINCRILHQLLIIWTRKQYICVKKCSWRNQMTNNIHFLWVLYFHPMSSGVIWVGILHLKEKIGDYASYIFCLTINWKLRRHGNAWFSRFLV